MNHAITLGGLLLFLGVLGGGGTACAGVLMCFAAGMSDAGDDGTGKQGCITFVVGVAIFVGSLWGLLS